MAQKILYQFKCEGCQETCEKYLTVANRDSKKCPACREDKLYRLYSCIVGTFPVTTLGQQAKINAKRVGKEKLEEIENSDCTREVKEFK